MKATLYTWEGSPDRGRKRAIGVVRLDGHTAVWDASIDAYLNPLPRDPRLETYTQLDPAKGREFIEAMPYVFKSPPYNWAEVDD